MRKNQIIKNKQELINVPSDERTSQARKTVLNLLEEGIIAADPVKAIKETIKLKHNKIIINNKHKFTMPSEGKLYVVGGGKAVVKMARGLEEIFRDKITKGMINCLQDNIATHDLKYIETFPAGHPYPTEGTLEGTKKMIDLLSGVSKEDIVFFLISGGGSALMELPQQDISLNDLKKIFEILTKNGASIHELNAIRKHLSQIKGGRLAQKAQPATVIALIISDVVGDDLDTIASGPTTGDPTTWHNVKEIIEKYQIWDDLPIKIQEVVHKGLRGEIEETPKVGEGFFANVHNYLIANNRKSCQKIRQRAKDLGFKAEIISTEITGEAKKIGKQLAETILKSKKQTILIAGGETTVTITGTGKGGRNQELVLAASKIIAGIEGIVLASIGTDGKDGPTDAAGALVDGNTMQRGITKGLSITEHLQNNDSYNYFKKIAELIITGPTETNVMDLMIAMKL